MTRFQKLRELLGRARAFEREAHRMRNGPNRRGAADRLREAESYRLKAALLSGRIDRDEYAAALDDQDYAARGW